MFFAELCACRFPRVILRFLSSGALTDFGAATIDLLEEVSDLFPEYPTVLGLAPCRMIIS